MRTHDQVLSSLSHHVPDEVGQQTIGALRERAKAFAGAIESYVPPGRSKALAQTKLEECLMWAIKGIVLPKEDR